jgi:flagellar protein FlgJ
LAINPPSDIVLDVARAADPLKLQAAALKLTGAVDDDGNNFTSLVDGLDPSLASRPAVISTPGLIGLQSDFGPKGAQMERSPALSGPEMKPYRDFEALVLQTFVQNMLPKDAEGIFGHGTAGEMWKSILAEQLGKQIARAGGIGIAAQVSKAHPGAAASAGLDRAPLGLKSNLGLQSNLALMAPLAAHSDQPPPSVAPRTAEIAPLDISPRNLNPKNINPKGDVSAPATQIP